MYNFIFDGATKCLYWVLSIVCMCNGHSNAFTVRCDFVVKFKAILFHFRLIVHETALRRPNVQTFWMWVNIYLTWTTKIVCLKRRKKKNTHRRYSTVSSHERFVCCCCHFKQKSYGLLVDVHFWICAACAQNDLARKNTPQNYT